MTRVSLDLGDGDRMDVQIKGEHLDEVTIAALREIGEATLRKMRERDPEADAAFLDAVENGGFAPGEEDG